MYGNDCMTSVRVCTTQQYNKKADIQSKVIAGMEDLAVNISRISTGYCGTTSRRLSDSILLAPECLLLRHAGTLSPWLASYSRRGIPSCNSCSVHEWVYVTAVTLYNFLHVPVPLFRDFENVLWYIFIAAVIDWRLFFPNWKKNWILDCASDGV